MRRSPRTSRALLAVALLATTMGIATRSAVAQPSPSVSPGLDLIQSHRMSPRLEELRFRTPALVGETRVRVLLPKGYDRSGRTRYPVLFLLHGGGGSFRDWTTSGDAEALSAPYPMIVVMPDTSGYGNYVDWYNNGAGGPPMWETFHIGQLLPWVDAHYPTVGTRAGRAIAGLSMGGGGAMGYAARHPDLFAAAAAFSGAVDVNSPYVQPLVETSGWQEGRPPGSVMGHRLTEEVRWRGHNPWDLAENLRGMYLELHTGNGLPGGPEGLGDPVEFAVHEEMVSLHDRLGELGIPHLWNDYGPGGHSWFYWQRDLRQLLPRLAELFAHPVPAPSRIDHASIAPTWSVFGWQVRMHRPAVEFSRLAGAGRDGFVLRGSGWAGVTTPAAYRPGEALQVTVLSSAGRSSAVRRADDQGRLRVVVPLGPGNPYQQLSPAALVWQAGRAVTGAPGHLTDTGLAWPVYTATVSIQPP